MRVSLTVDRHPLGFISTYTYEIRLYAYVRVPAIRVLAPFRIPVDYSRWQRLIIPRKVHPPIIGGRRWRLYIVTDSSLLRYYYGRLAPFSWLTPYTRISSLLNSAAALLTRWKAMRALLYCISAFGRRAGRGVACLSHTHTLHFWFSIELLGSLNTSDTSHSSRVGEENGIITSARLTEGRTPLLQPVKITQQSVFKRRGVKTVNIAKFIIFMYELIFDRKLHLFNLAKSSGEVNHNCWM